MDKVALTTIELHLAEQVQENLAQFAKSLSSGLTTPEMEVIESAELGNGIAGDSDAAQTELPQTEPKAAKLGDEERSSILRDPHHAKNYEKLLLEGKDNNENTHAEHALDILNEVAPQLAATKQSTFAPVPLMTASLVNTEFDEELFLEPEENQEGYEEEDSDDEEDCENDEFPAADDDLQSLKETNPGYFRSMLVKI